MKTVHALLLVAGVFLSGCEDKTPQTPSIPAETAGEAMRRDDADIARRLAAQKATVELANAQARASLEKQQRIAALRDLGTRWVAGVEAALKTGRSELAPALQKLDAIRSEMAGVETDDCTAKAREAMQSAMSATLEALNQFKSETGKPSEAVQKKMAEASTAMAEADGKLTSCPTV